MIKKGFSHIGIYFLYGMSLFPFPVLFFISRILYYPLYYIVAYRRKVVRENLLKSFPEKSLAEIVSIEKTFYKYLTDLMVEIVKMTTISDKTLNERVKFENLHVLEEYFKKGESVLACTGHYGNWELAMLAVAKKVSATPYVIYKPLSNKIFEKWLLDIRTKTGNVFIAMRQTLRALVAAKDETTMFCFASDQTPTREEAHYFLNFLNQPTAALLGLEKVALQTNRPIFYFEVTVMGRGRYKVNCIPMCMSPKETSNHEITDLLFERFEHTIKSSPPYWLWSHRRWKLNN